jgi:hypothetical protein
VLNSGISGEYEQEKQPNTFNYLTNLNFYLRLSGAGTQEEFTWNLVQSGGAICLSIVLILIPVVLLLIWVLTRKPKDPYDQKEPTGASSDDPLPPTR